MLSFWLGVLGNVVANVVFWALLGVVFWGIAKASREKIARFLGLGRSNHVRIILSNIWRPEGSMRQVGFSISRHELQASNIVTTFLQNNQGRAPDIVRGLVDHLWLRGRINSSVDVSPPGDVDTVDATEALIVIGSACCNSYRRHYLASGAVAASLENEVLIGYGVNADDVHRVSIDRAGGDKQLVQSEQGLAVVEKIGRPDRSGSVFFCYGARSEGSWLAADFLVRNWRSLDREFKGEPFVVCLGFPYAESFSSMYVEPGSVTVLARISP
ncbi:hypothetical protein [Lentzea sp. NEAU-D7]|uniref:hypothetical protein n=1 Tax=Lentzea sp. NEAU-D7 TaxID=2994667 RepID=UPI00224B0A58|nr:hypothetical protein [Lentzea sp. NEAU-D7]MCX2950177.1 hypothetical protein [Lentzea sp. NEAU-D7]